RARRGEHGARSGSGDRGAPARARDQERTGVRRARTDGLCDRATGGHAAMNATLHTNHGPIDIELYPEEAPKTVDNFVKLARDGFYDGLIFHRVIPDFMI